MCNNVNAGSDMNLVLFLQKNIEVLHLMIDLFKGHEGGKEFHICKALIFLK